MRESIAIAIGMLVCFLFLALSCEKQKPHIEAKTVLLPLVWNYANASVPSNFDLPTHRDETDESIQDPSEAGPYYLTEPCGTWNAMSPSLQQTFLDVRVGEHVTNGCGQCHCNWIQDRYVPFGGTGSLCITINGGLVPISYWRDNPDNLVIRWRP